MKKIVNLILILFCSIVLFSGMRVSADGFNIRKLSGREIADESGILGSRIDVAVTGESELDPAVAQCGNNYLVVYVKNGDIYGQLLDLEGLLVGDTITIFEGDNDSSTPDVACLWPTIFDQYFLVVWTYDWSGIFEDYDVYIQALTLDGNLLNSWIPIANSLDNEMKPAIACEVDDHTCLVVYEKEVASDTDIMGRRVHMTNFGLDLPENEFYTGSDGDHDLNPNVTWSMTQEEYLLVWQDWYVGGLTYYDRIRLSSIYEDEHGTGYDDEVKLSPVYLNPPYLTGDYPQEFPDVAFNNHLGRYLSTYSENRVTTNAAVGDLTLGITHWGAMDFENNAEPRVVVAYSGGPTGILNAENEFLAINIELQEAFYQLQGTYIWEGELLNFAKDIPIETASNEDMIQNPDICGTPATGHYLVVWEHGQPATGYNIYGRLVGNGGFFKHNLPMVSK